MMILQIAKGNRFADAVLGAGWVSIMYGWLGAATEIAQFIAILLGIGATVLAIYVYLLKIKEIKKGKNGDI